MDGCTDWQLFWYIGLPLHGICDGLQARQGDDLDQPSLLVAARALGLRMPESVAPLSLSSDQVSLTVRRAVPFTVVDGGEPQPLISSEATVAQALREWGIGLGPGDEVEPEVSSYLPETTAQVKPGGTTTVVALSSMMDGPAMTLPARSRSPS